MENKISDYLVKYFPKDLAEIIIQYGYKWYGLCDHTINRTYVNCLAVLKSGTDEYLIGGSNDNTLKIWNTKTYECIKTLEGHTDVVLCVAVLSEQLVLSGSRDTTVKLWNTKNYNENVLISTFVGHTHSVFSVAFISEKLIVSGSRDKTLKIWNIEKKSCVLNLTGHTQWIYSCEVLSNDPINSTMRIIGTDGHGTIIIWTIKNENNTKLSLIDHQDIIDPGSSIFKVFMHPLYKNTIAAKIFTSKRKVINIWNIKTFECEQTLCAHSDWIRCIAMLPDGRLISGSDDKKLKISNLDTNNDNTPYSCDITLEGHTDCVLDVVVLSDGRIVSCSWDSTIKIWY